MKENNLFCLTNKFNNSKFKYDYFFDFIKKIVICSNDPLQVELHPGKSCGGFDCKFCYGYGKYLNEDEELSIENYYKLIDDLKSRVNFITLAGIKSDPLCNKDIYKIIKRIKENNLRLGISTKGLLLNETLSNLLNINTDYGDFITFSIDSSNSDFFNKIHGLDSGSKFFEVINKNIKYLYERKVKVGSNLNVNVSYLLFKGNDSEKDIRNFVNIFHNCSDVIRFSVPQIPNSFDKKPDFFLDDIGDIVNIIKRLQKEYSDKKIVFLGFGESEHKYIFKYCFAQKFLSVIDNCGNVYPCPQVATKDYNYLTYGNIKEKSFWDIWNSLNRKKILKTDVKKLNCLICDRKDEELNIKLSEIFGNETEY